MQMPNFQLKKVISLFTKYLHNVIQETIHEAKIH